MRDLDDLTQYAYGLLDESAEAEIRDHAAGCPDCAARIERLVAEHRFLEACLRPDAPPPSPGVVYPFLRRRNDDTPEGWPDRA